MDENRYKPAQLACDKNLVSNVCKIYFCFMPRSGEKLDMSLKLTCHDECSVVTVNMLACVNMTCLHNNVSMGVSIDIVA